MSTSIDESKNRKMEESKKFRGVRQRQWGPWVSEIRHPILKKRVWLGTFGSAEEAARAYDQAAVIMCGRNAKTNFPMSQSQPNNELEEGLINHKGKTLASSSSSNDKKSLSQIIHSKLQKPTKASSLTCLRLDTERSLIGVWQMGGGSRSESKWVMTLDLETNQQLCHGQPSGGLVGGLAHGNRVAWEEETFALNLP